MVNPARNFQSPVLIASTLFCILSASRRAVAKVWCQSSNDKLLQHPLEAHFAQPDQRVLHHQSGAIAIALGMVEIGNASRSKGFRYIRIIRLPAHIVTFANHRASESVQQPRSSRTSSFQYVQIEAIVAIVPFIYERYDSEFARSRS